MAEKLHLLEKISGRPGLVRTVMCRSISIMHRLSPSVAAAPRAAFVATARGRRGGGASRRAATGAQRRMADEGYFASRCKGAAGDRKSVVEGNSLSDRVASGGRRFVEKKNKDHTSIKHSQTDITKSVA